MGIRKRWGARECRGKEKGNDRRRIGRGGEKERERRRGGEKEREREGEEGRRRGRGGQKTHVGGGGRQRVEERKRGRISRPSFRNIVNGVEKSNVTDFGKGRQGMYRVGVLCTPTA